MVADESRMMPVYKACENRTTANVPTKAKLKQDSRERPTRVLLMVSLY